MDKYLEIENTDKLQKVFQDNICILYGAGKVCRIVTLWASQHNLSIDSIIVSSMLGNPKNVLGIPVKQINDVEIDTEGKTLILCVYKEKQEEILRYVNRIQYLAVYVLTDDLINSLLYESAALDFELMDILQSIKKENKSILDELYGIKNAKMRLTPQPRLQYFILNICEHCNLNCKGCNHFSCLAKEYFMKPKEIERDLKRMYEVHGDVPRIGIMGGEPFLHPQLEEILVISRKAFPKTELLLSTNGTLCDRMEHSFWNTCRECNISVRFTKYPIGLDYEKLAMNIRKRGIKVEYFLEEHEMKEFQSIAVDIEGRQNPTSSFSECGFGNQCVMLSEGKLYTCQIIANIKHFNDTFGTALPVEHGDYIDIYTTDEEETLKKLAKPAPFCRFCNIPKRRVSVFQWGSTQKQMEEWL